MTKFNFYFGAVASAWLLTILIIIAELVSPFKTFLANIFKHHWIGKGVLITLTFLIVGFLLKDKTSLGNVPDDKLAWYSMLGSLIVIFLFFIIEFFK